VACCEVIVVSGKYLLDPNWWLVVFALVAVIVAIWTQYNQTHSFKLTIGADLAMKLDERFNEHDFLKIRVVAAKALRTNSDVKRAEDIFDFFDTVGLFVRLGALDPRIAHSLFFYWINLYWRAGEKYIKAEQQKAKLRWDEFAKLYAVTRRFEENRDPSSENLSPTPELTAAQLDDEIALLDEG
jgi:hypothetical protein